MVDPSEASLLQPIMLGDPEGNLGWELGMVVHRRHFKAHKKVKNYNLVPIIAFHMIKKVGKWGTSY